MVDKTPKDNVIHFHLRRADPSERKDFIAIARSLIDENATHVRSEVQETGQLIAGDSNVQFSSGLAPRQSITGNFNIQIATTDAGLEQRLAFLETFLKKQNCT